MNITENYFHFVIVLMFKMYMGKDNQSLKFISNTSDKRGVLWSKGEQENITLWSGVMKANGRHL